MLLEVIHMHHVKIIMIKTYVSVMLRQESFVGIVANGDESVMIKTC
jgi:hypothetical protein